MQRIRVVYLCLGLICLWSLGVAVQTADPQKAIDAKVSKFLLEHRFGWRDMNVPESDGRALNDLVVKNGYKQALEIGTSTGHSGIWIAWALSKTGGKLITIDIDQGRHDEAVANFRAVGLSAYIDARLADAHELVGGLGGPFDFVFIDADKDWYTRYAKAVIPKLRIGGCLTAHNVSQYGGRRQMTGDFYDYITGLPFLETTMIDGGNGLSVSYKRRAQ